MLCCIQNIFELLFLPALLSESSQNLLLTQENYNFSLWLFLICRDMLLTDLIVDVIGVFMMTSSNGKKIALLCLCALNPPVTGEFPLQRPVTRSFGVFHDLRLNKRLSKQSKHRWFETSSRPLWRHFNDRQHTRFVSTYVKAITPSLVMIMQISAVPVCYSYIYFLIANVINHCLLRLL